MEPRAERSLRVVAIPPLEGPHEDVLGRLLDVTLVVEQSCQHDGDAPLVAAHELAERLEVTCLCALDELDVAGFHRAIVGG